MSEYNEKEFEEVLNFVKTCPYLPELWTMSEMLNNGDNSLELADVSRPMNVTSEEYADCYKIVFSPEKVYYSTYYVSLFRYLYPEENTYNNSVIEAMNNVCKWFFEQQENGATPNLSKETPLKIVLNTPRALRRGTYNDDGQMIQDFYISFNLYKVNPCKKEVIRLEY